MSEQITLTIPETKPNNTGYKIASIMEDWIAGTITLQLIGLNGEARVCKYGPNGLTRSNGTVNATAPTGETLLRQQNRANFSSNSRQKAIFNRLITDGELTGIVTGIPD